MNGPDRFRTLVGRVTEAADGDTLGCLEGIDPVTGLPVLIYDFEGAPLAAPGDIESGSIPKILWSSNEDGRGRIVAALSPGWQRLSDDSGPLALARLLDATRAVRDAADAGIAHGDIWPRRLLLVEGRLQVEGFGVPWQPRPGRYRAPEVTEAATLAGDIYSLAKTVEVVGFSAADQTVAAVLEQCMAHEPVDRPSAEELYLALEALADQQPEAAASSSAVQEDEARVTPAAIRSTSSAGRPIGAAEGVPEAAGSSVAGGRESAGTSASVRVRSPAPEGTEEPREKRIRLGLLGALMAAVIIFALLALYGPRGNAPSTAEPLEDVVYVVQVEVVPDDLPPVAIHLISAPEGSSLTRSDTIGTAPRHLALDRAGTWSFQGRLEGRTSDVVEIEVPEERTVTLVMPPAPAR